MGLKSKTLEIQTIMTICLKSEGKTRRITFGLAHIVVNWDSQRWGVVILYCQIMSYESKSVDICVDIFKIIGKKT
jgi:hypothetical protein